jgi:hypothetical protein
MSDFAITPVPTPTRLPEVQAIPAPAPTQPTAPQQDNVTFSDSSQSGYQGDFGYDTNSQ